MSVRRPVNLTEDFHGFPQSLRANAGIVVTVLSRRKPGFAPGSAHARFVVYKVAMGQVFL
jgi:hypothetical protein